MITVREAENKIAQAGKIFPAVTCSLEKAAGRILREDIFADRDFPAINRVTMDGFAIDGNIFEKGVRKFIIEGTQAAGQESLPRKKDNGCVEIMTGAALPEGCTCVVPVEEAVATSGTITVDESFAPEKMKNVVPQGSETKSGTRLLKPGDVLTAANLAICAAVGKASVKVSMRPKIAVISTGNELVDINRPVLPHQIRKSNSFALFGALQQTGLAAPEIFHLRDNKNQMKTKLADILRMHDMFVFIGGVSKGKFDFVPAVLNELGAKVVFHKVAQRPGKPLWFGTTANDKLIFALPGNPLSAQVCCFRYVIPQIKRSLGIDYIKKEYAVLSRAYNSNTDLTHFLPVKCMSSLEGKRAAVPIHVRGSGDLTALANSDGFIELEANTREFPKYHVAPFFCWS